MNLGTVLVVEDDADLRDVLTETLELAGYRVIATDDGERAIEVLGAREDISLILSDVQMRPMDGITLLDRLRAAGKRVPVVMMTAYGTVEDAVSAMHKGAADYLVKPFDVEGLLDIVARHASVMEAGVSEAGGFIAVDEVSRQLVDVASRVASTDATVMISGDSGVGKEVVSRFIHEKSSRAEGPFVAINCAAIPESMLESVLFGYEKGAYTGAHQSKEGKFEQAQGGTLLLDEITEMDLGLQAKLLRVLQEREVERIGGRRTITLDVRVIATSNRDLRQAVTEGRFREDLFYRLNVFPIHVPALRKRKQDILPLAQSMLRKYTDGNSTPALTSAAMSALSAHDWPGNVRELDNVVQRALILRSGDVIDRREIRFERLQQANDNDQEVTLSALAQDANTASGLNRDMQSHEKELIISALRRNSSRKEVAATLGISPRTLRYKLAKLRDAGVALPA